MDERDEVVNEFDQTNGKAPGLEGDGGDSDGDEVRDENVVTRLVDDLVDPPENGGERRD